MVDATLLVEHVAELVTVALRRVRGLRPGVPNTFDLITQDQILSIVSKFTTYFFVAMVALSSVALLVGGIGVMAIMMISVTERTREIGVRKALGARRREILWQFLIEAAFLTSAGGLLGILFGSSIGLAVHWLTNFPVSLPWWSFALGIGFSASVGIFCGNGVPATNYSIPVIGNGDGVAWACGAVSTGATCTGGTPVAAGTGTACPGGAGWETTGEPGAAGMARATALAAVSLPRIGLGGARCTATTAMATTIRPTTAKPPNILTVRRSA